MKLEELFQQSGVKKSHAAKILNVSPNTVSNWVKGSSYPTLDKAIQLAKLLHVEITDLYEE
ncbi:helix-turn-helix transcriptional regulator [Halobacillus sp. A5]|uniref:helix-turn-helix domain-containing protein n=1 Tax=Halobacillus sp. A5 TaxID=2880263 RepID=UPI0020A6518D|nr:helix-turn-helix transcriptional regulator [Halobacillus sp. A5]MCP3025431.1 helix-turn-helix domain-containing protein [Halobacillus sp. A5]